VERPVGGKSVSNPSFVGERPNPLFHLQVDIDDTWKVVILVPVRRGVGPKEFLGFEVGHSPEIKLREVGFHSERAARPGDAFVSDERLEYVECSRAAVARVLAGRIADGQDITNAVFATMDERKATPGAICPIEDVPKVRTDEVSIEGRVIELWDADSPAIAQAGLIADETGKIKFTSFRRSRPSYVKEGETVRMRNLKKNYYRGRCSLAVTADSWMVFPDRDERWWEA
jgi:hypothetical protein